MPPLGGLGDVPVTYDAFISYSHAKDRPIANALQSVVQKLGKPWYRRRTLRLFRDDTSLSATPHLWPSIERALSRSRFLILIASPEAAVSRWVDQELAYWSEHNSADTVLIALTGGELDWDQATGDFRWSEATPLPAALKSRFTTEPRWIDLRPYRDGTVPKGTDFMGLDADFAATIRGIPKEDLLSQEVRQQRRALTLAWSAAGALVALLGVAGWQWQEARLQRDQAQIERDRARSQLQAVEARRANAGALTPDDRPRRRGREDRTGRRRARRRCRRPTRLDHAERGDAVGAHAAQLAVEIGLARPAAMPRPRRSPDICASSRARCGSAACTAPRSRRACMR